MTKDSAAPVDTFFGNCLNVFHIVNTIIFMGLVLAQHNGLVNIFSPSYAKDGFCVSNKEKSIWEQSHAMSFCGDTAFAIFLWVVTRYFSQGLEEASLKPVT